ncbi:MAG: biotin carboxylase [Myxococcales bacterium]|nr:biotin carboxylase [Myxococcales bacterium]
MLNREHLRQSYAENASPWVRSFHLSEIKCLIVCRGPVRKEAMDTFDAIGIAEYGILLSEKDSIVYPKCLAPELRDFRFPHNIHRVPDYMGAGAAEKQERIDEIIAIARDGRYTHLFAGYGFMAEDADFIEAVERAGLRFMGPASRVARAVGAKDEAKKLARGLGISVTPGVDNVSALALLRRCKNLKALEQLAAKHELGCELSAARELSDNAEALLQAGYGRGVELVTIEELQAEAARQCETIWSSHPEHRIRFKYIGGGGGKGQRVISKADEVAGAVMNVLAESKVVAAGANRNFLIELNIETTRHNEIQMIGNGQWCLSLGGRDCSVQMHEQKLLEISLTQEQLDEELEHARAGGQKARISVLEADRRALAEMEAEAEALGQAVQLDSVSTFEAIVEDARHYFMEVNTRIQVEHRVTEQAYVLRFDNPDDADDHFYVDSLIEAMALLSVHGPRLPRPTRVTRHRSGAEVRINATNQALQPHAGGIISTWSDPLPDETRDDQGIGIRNPDTGAFVYYRLAGAYDSNIALVITHGASRRENLERLAEILRRTELRGYDLQTNLQVHYGLLAWILGHDAMIKPNTQFMDRYLAAVGAIAGLTQDIDLALLWQKMLEAQQTNEARQLLRLKQTLLMRPVHELLQTPHLLAGFLGLHGGRLWRRDGGSVDFADNPVTMLERLYHFLHLDAGAGRPPSQAIWDHDQRILESAQGFYRDVHERLGTGSWPALREVLESEGAPPPAFGDEPELWQRVRASHAGFQLGMELLLLLPRIGQAAGFFDIEVGEDLTVRFPDRLNDREQRAQLQRNLAPPPAASSDEVVTPMGGHFYSREAPHLPPLVQEGMRFEAGQPLFVIEVMKMFNRVSVPFSGRVLKVLLHDADGTIVQKGQPILKIEPDERIVVESPEQVAARRRAVTLALLEAD